MDTMTSPASSCWVLCAVPPSRMRVTTISCARPSASRLHSAVKTACCGGSRLHHTPSACAGGGEFCLAAGLHRLQHDANPRAGRAVWRHHPFYAQPLPLAQLEEYLTSLLGPFLFKFCTTWGNRRFLSLFPD